MLNTSVLWAELSVPRVPNLDKFHCKNFFFIEKTASKIQFLLSFKKIMLSSLGDYFFMEGKDCNLFMMGFLKRPNFSFEARIQ